MCYMLYLSTTSPEDLASESSELLRLERKEPPAAIAAKLGFPHRWFAGSASICSCTFRHLTDPGLGFGRAEDWSPEDADALEATLEFVAVVRKVQAAGHRVDCVDAWLGDAPVALRDLEVDLSRMADDEFRFFENYHFTFVEPVVGGEVS